MGDPWTGTGVERYAAACDRAPVLTEAWAAYAKTLHRIDLARREIDVTLRVFIGLAGFDARAVCAMERPLRFRHVIDAAWAVRTLPSQLVNVTMFDEVVLSRPAMAQPPCPDVAAYRVRNCVKQIMRMTRQSPRHIRSQTGVPRNVLEDVLHTPEDGEECRLFRVPVLQLLVLLYGMNLNLYDALGQRRSGEPSPRPGHQETM